MSETQIRIRRTEPGDADRRFGVEVEGTAIGYSFREGEFVDAHMMARLRTR